MKTKLSKETNEVHKKYKHLDHLLSDRKWLMDNFWGGIIYDLWQAIKGEVEKGEVKKVTFEDVKGVFKNKEKPEERKV